MSLKHVHTKICTCMLYVIATSFIIAKPYKQPRCSSVGGWINTWWYIHTMQHYSVLKINELSSHENTQRELNCIILSERSQFEKATSYMIPILWHPGKGKTIDTVKR